ncbi:MAG: hypothetical protein J6E46_10560 [Faecalicoccus sp.]|nr:hypothetical protein [Faecalicoccus sp.]
MSKDVYRCVKDLAASFRNISSGFKREKEDYGTYRPGLRPIDRVDHYSHF